MNNISFTRVEESIENTGIKCFLYGKSGVGKTVIAATCPRPLLLNVEKGFLSLSSKNLYRIFGDDPSITHDMPMMSVNSVEGIEQAVSWLLETDNIVNFDTIIVDSYSDIAESVLFKRLDENTNKQKAYGEMATDLIKLSKIFRDIPDKNIVLLSKCKTILNGETGLMMNVPLLQGKILPDALPYYFDEVLYLDVKTNEDGSTSRYIQTGITEYAFAKDRGGALDLYEEAHLGKIFEKLKGE